MKRFPPEYYSEYIQTRFVDIFHSLVEHFTPEQQRQVHMVAEFFFHEGLLLNPDLKSKESAKKILHNLTTT